MGVIGMDLGGTKLAVALFTPDGEIRHKKISAVAGRQGSEVGALISAELEAAVSVARQLNIDVDAVGVSVPGIFFSADGTVWAPNIPGWDRYPLLEVLENQANGRFPVAIDSDRACYILGETWMGSATGCQDAIFIAVGTGIGAGILINGRILRGNNDIAGAIGWMALDRPYTDRYDACGCFEYHASGSGIAQNARERLNKDPGYQGILRKAGIDTLTAQDIFRAYEAGDRLASEVIQNAVECWGMAAANLISLFNPEKIIFGGGVFGPAAGLIDDIDAEARKWAQPIGMNEVEIIVTSLGPDAGLYGTGKLALLP